MLSLLANLCIVARAVAVGWLAFTAVRRRCELSHEAAALLLLALLAFGLRLVWWAGKLLRALGVPEVPALLSSSVEELVNAHVSLVVDSKAPLAVKGGVAGAGAVLAFADQALPLLSFLSWLPALLCQLALALKAMFYLQELLGYFLTWVVSKAAGHGFDFQVVRLSPSVVASRVYVDVEVSNFGICNTAGYPTHYFVFCSRVRVFASVDFRAAGRNLFAFLRGAKHMPVDVGSSMTHAHAHSHSSSHHHGLRHSHRHRGGDKRKGKRSKQEVMSQFDQGKQSTKGNVSAESCNCGHDGEPTRIALILLHKLDIEGAEINFHLPLNGEGAEMNILAFVRSLEEGKMVKQGFKRGSSTWPNLLRVHLRSAHLHGDRDARRDVYAEATLRWKCRRSLTIHKSHEPLFNEECTFYIADPSAVLVVKLVDAHSKQSLCEQGLVLGRDIALKGGSLSDQRAYFARGFSFLEYSVSWEHSDSVEAKDLRITSAALQQMKVNTHEGAYRLGDMKQMFFMLTHVPILIDTQMIHVHNVRLDMKDLFSGSIGTDHCREYVTANKSSTSVFNAQVGQDIDDTIGMVPSDIVQVKHVELTHNDNLEPIDGASGLTLYQFGRRVALTLLPKVVKMETLGSSTLAIMEGFMVNIWNALTKPLSTKREQESSQYIKCEDTLSYKVALLRSSLGMKAFSSLNRRFDVRKQDELSDCDALVVKMRKPRGTRCWKTRKLKLYPGVALYCGMKGWERSLRIDLCTRVINEPSGCVSLEKSDGDVLAQLRGSPSLSSKLRRFVPAHITFDERKY